MGRAPCCSKVGLHRGPWTAREDALLIKYIEAHGEGQWRSLPKKAGLLRCGKSCRLRWMNYLRPDIKRGNITPDEDDLIIRMHGLLGNRWSLIAGRLPGRTDNEIKNYWNTHLSKKLRSQGTDPNTHKKLPEFDPDDHKLVSKKIKCSKSSTNRSVSSQSLENKKQVVMMKDDIIRKEDVKKTKIHLPKPVRVTNVISLTRNNSNGSIETSVSTTSASSSQSQYQNHGLTFDSENSNNNILDMPMPWLSSSDHDANNMLDENGFDHLMMMASCGDHHDVDQVTAPEDQNQQLEQLFEEYLQVIKADHHHGHNDHDDGDGDHLDSFAESFLI